jgi:HSP20 family protein
VAISKWNPLQEVNRFFDDVFDHLPTRFGFDLAVDLYQDGNDLIAEMSVPGIDIKNTEVNVVGDILRVSGHREERKEQKEKNYYSREIHRGSFERSLRLPSAVISEETKATYKNGVLKITMPLKKTAEHKKIEIKNE